jgi:hypothetical protein
MCFMDNSSLRSLPETRARFCPHCLSLAVLPAGHVIADSTGVRCGYRYRECSKEFVLIR